MKKIEAFVHALKQGHALSLDSDGNWKVSLALLRRWQDVRLAQGMAAVLDRLERTPVADATAIAYGHYAVAAEMVASRLRHLSSKHAKQLKIDLEYRCYALRYRVGIKHGGWDKCSECRSEALERHAITWKQEQDLIWDKLLTERELFLMQRAARYPYFVELLLADAGLRERFFCWTLRDGIAPEPFIEYPGICDTLIRSNLCGRIGFYGGEMLHICHLNGMKTLTLPFEGRAISILDTDEKVELTGGLTMTIGEVFAVFANKWKRVGTLECFHDGIRNWDVHYLGHWCALRAVCDKIDLTRDQWWEQLPPTCILSAEEASNKYGVALDGRQWAAIACASRESPTLDYDKSHAYLQMIVPDSKGDYRVYAFGKYAFRFPTNFWECVTMFSVSMHATIAYPDENIFLTKRQHVGYSFLLTPRQGMQAMAIINNDMRMSRYGHIVFQIETENCGRWIQNLLMDIFEEGSVPNLFRFPLILAEPVGIVGTIFGWLRFLPRETRGKVLARLHYPFGAWRGHWVRNKQGRREWKAMTTSSFWEDGIVYLPAFLHKQVEIGRNKKQH